MKLIYKNHVKFYKSKLFYLKGENVMIDKILSLKEDVFWRKCGTLERDNQHCDF